MAYENLDSNGYGTAREGDPLRQNPPEEIPIERRGKKRLDDYKQSPDSSLAYPRGRTDLNAEDPVEPVEGEDA